MIGASVRDCCDLIDVVLRQGGLRRDELAYRFLCHGEVDGPQETVSFGELERKARALGAVLQDYGDAGERALLLFPPGLDFIHGFVGCLLGGMVAVPVTLDDPARPERALKRVRAVAKDAQARFVLTTTDIAHKAQGLLADEPAYGMRWICVDALPDRIEETWRRPARGADDLAFLQYTSGSTADPRGVMVRHGNLLHNLRRIAERMALTEDGRILSWLPVHHDMGLIGGVIMPLWGGLSSTLMSPQAFLERAERWLHGLSHFRANITMAPNFAYALVLRRTFGLDLDDLDLSSVTTVANGAEPVNADLIEKFCQRFAPHGLRPRSFFTCYGLAEATLMVTSVGAPAATPSLRVSPSHLQLGRACVQARDVSEGPRIASCGRPAEDMRVLVVDPQSCSPCAPDQVGEVWVQGPSVAAGYWNRPEETEQHFGASLASGDGPFLRTGDLGFLRDGEIYITGRLKDLIIVRGRNHYPQDIEQTVEACHREVRSGCVVAFGAQAEGEERLVVVAETRAPLTAEQSFAELVTAVRQAVAHRHGVELHALLLVERNSIPKTTSGKLRRALCRQSAWVEGAHVLRRWTRSEASAQAAPRSQAALETFLIENIAAALGVAPSRIDPAAPLDTLGLDSIMSVEVVNAAATAFGHQVAAGSLSRSLSIREIAAASRAETGKEPGEAPLSAASSPAGGGSGIVPPHLERFARRMTPVLERVARSRAEGSFFFERPVSALDGDWVECGEGERLLMFATYNYLGLLGHPRIDAAAKQAIERYGTGTHGVRLLGGSLDLHHRLEQRIAEFFGRGAAVTFSSGFMTNLTAISTLVGPGDWVIADQLNHASIVDGCATSGAVFRVFRHNDMDHLESILKLAPRDAAVLVVADALFSLDGDILDLPRTVELCRRHGALLMVDEAHSLGVLGTNGRGIEDHFNLPGSIDIVMGTLSKTIPAIGGFIASSPELIEFLRYSARGYVFSAALPPAVAAAALTALDVIDEEGTWRRAVLKRNSSTFLAELQAAGFDTGQSCSPIIPLILGSDENALRMTRYCQERGLFVLPALPPAVPPGTARLRLNVTAEHTFESIRHALDILIAGGREFFPDSIRPAGAAPDDYWRVRSGSSSG